MPEQIDRETLIELISLGERLSEDRLYEIVIDEVERNEFDNVAKAKALEEAEGDQNKARAFYTKHRVRRLRDLITKERIAADAERVRSEERELQAENERREAEQREKDHKKKREDSLFAKENIRFTGFAFSLWVFYLIICAVTVFWVNLK